MPSVAEGMRQAVRWGASAAPSAPLKERREAPLGNRTTLAHACGDRCNGRINIGGHTMEPLHLRIGHGIVPWCADKPCVCVCVSETGAPAEHGQHLY
jgi:hypothetical protein